MINASELTSGAVVKLEGSLFRILDTEYQSGSSQFGKMLHARARNIMTGHIKDWRFKPDEKIELADLQRQEWEFLYQDGDIFYFMDPQTFEQIPVEKQFISGHEKFLLPNMHLQAELYQGKVIHIAFPSYVQLKVVSAPAGHREHDSSTYKRIVLENGVEVLAPQFIRDGEYVRIDPQTGKYIDRVTF